jgi:CRISPR-associated protein Cas2
MSKFSDYAVVYDIACDKERGKVDKILKGFGFRVQKSVFECRLTKGGKTELIEKLKALDIQTGFIKLYRLEYSFKSCLIGKKQGNDIDNNSAFII